MATDISIAQAATLEHIKEIGKILNIKESDLELFGNYKAKVPLSYIDEAKWKKSNLVLVTAISPTPAGEGKTTTSIGLNDGLNKIGVKSTVVLREPSLGPVFGIKGGATGGGYAQVLPMEDINLHFTGDFSAIQAAHNLLSALVDNNIQNKHNNLNIDPRTVTWKRVMDMNDRALRDIIVGLGGKSGGMPRQTGFDITSASEVMAILCFAENFADLKHRLGKIFIGFTYDRKPIFARDLKAQGAMAALLKDAIKPNLVQSIEGNPAIIHGGPFANIAQGTNTVLATKMGLSLSDYVVTEAGFGADLGAEKFLDLKCVGAGLNPKAVVLVATVRALKYHGGVQVADLSGENIEAVKSGLVNLEKHVENMKKFKIQPVVAINHFVADTEAEIEAIRSHCETLGVKAVISKVWEHGGDGAIDLAKAVVEVVDAHDGGNFKAMYEWEWSVKKKISAISKKIYGAVGVNYTSQARKDLFAIKKLGLTDLPICMAKTQKSLSDDPKLIGRPEGFTITVRQIEIATGAGFLVPITGDMLRMPGLPSVPSAEHIDISDDGVITGLS